MGETDWRAGIDLFLPTPRDVGVGAEFSLGCFLQTKLRKGRDSSVLEPQENGWLLNVRSSGDVGLGAKVVQCLLGCHAKSLGVSKYFVKALKG